MCSPRRPDRLLLSTGLFSPLTASLASWIVQPPFMFVTAAAAMVTPFAIGDLDWRAFPQAWLIYGVTNWSFEGYGQFFALASHPLLGLMNFMQLFFAMFLFCGMFIDLTNLTWVAPGSLNPFPSRWSSCEEPRDAQRAGERRRRACEHACA